MEPSALQAFVGTVDWARLADEYLNGIDASPKGWDSLRIHFLSSKPAHGRCVVVETSDPEPYESEEAQHNSIERGLFLVSNQHCEHPYWSPADNVRFRAWHDIDGHESLRAPFNRYGEVAVFARHAEAIWHDPAIGTRADRRWAIDALFCESLLQLATWITTGRFAGQRCVLLGRYGRCLRDAIRFDYPRAATARLTTHHTKENYPCQS